MPRILFCSDSYPPQVNGVSVVTAAMVAGLQARGWECGVLAPAYPSRRRRVLWKPDGVQHFDVPSVPMPTYPEVRLAWPLRREVRGAFATFRPDVVHCATEFTVGHAGMREAGARGVPVCTTYHTDFSRYCAAYGLSWLRPAVRRWIRGFHQQAVRTLVPSRMAQEDVARLGLQHTLVWSGGVDVQQFHPRFHSTPTRQRHGLGKAFTLLHVGRLAPEKDVPTVLGAFARAKALLPHFPLRLLIAGAGPSEPALRAHAGAGVTFLGAIDRTNELPALYASVDAFVTASVTETLGLVVLEAMASGLPVIASPAGGLADLLQDARNGLTFPAGDENACARAIVALATDPSRHERLRAGARQTAEAWSAVREMDRLDAFFRGVVRSWPRQAVRQPLYTLHPAR